MTKRTYDDSNHLLSETVITAESGAAGYKTEWTYDGNGNKLTEKDPLGNISRWTYNGRGQVLTETDPLGNTTAYAYSPSGNLISSKDAAGNVTKYDYDLKGNLLSVTDNANNVTRFTYDQSGNVLSVKDALNHETTYTYDGYGNRTSETRKVTAANGEIQTLITRWTYDKEGRVKTVIDPENYLTEYRYDANGNEILVVDARQNQTEYVYDDKGQLVTTIYADDTPADKTDNPRTITLYDKGSRQRAAIDESGRITYYEYDAVGKLVATIYPDNTSDRVQQLLDVIAPGKTPATVDWTEIVYPDVAPAFVTNRISNRTEYYQNGQVKAEIDELGNRTEYRYDAEGQLIEVIYADDTPLSLANNHRTEYEYDKNGRRTVVELPLNQESTTTYDEVGNVQSVTDFNGNTITYEYDAQNRLIVKQIPAGSEQVETEFYYSPTGQIERIVDPRAGGESNFFYDGQGRLIARKDSYGEHLPSGNTIEYVYDTGGNRTQVKTPAGEVNYVYDERQRLVKVKLLSI